MAWNPNEINSEILAVHAALVPNGPQGEVVLFGGDEHWGAQQESAADDSWKKTRVYDVATHALVPSQVQSPDSDVFCAHHVFIGDGRLLIAGGTSKWPDSGDGHAHGLDFLGHNRCWLYNPRQRQWVETSRLNRNPAQPDEPESGGRWYPGLSIMGDGSAIALFGHLQQNDSRHRNTLPERFFPSGRNWVNLPKTMGKDGTPNSGGRRYLFFPRAYVLPSGKLFSATPLPINFETEPGSSDGAHFSTAYDVNTGDYVVPQANSADGVHGGWDFPAVMLPLLPRGGIYNARIMIWNGTSLRWINTDAATPTWTNTGPRDAAVSTRNRRFCNMVSLPNGQVCVVGGMHDHDPEDPVNQVELYTPDIDWTTNEYGSGNGTWSLEAGSSINNRNYHSTALLLPNGKVWVAGSSVGANSGNPTSVGILKIELYEPPYIAVTNRIVVQSAPKLLPYGQEFDVQLDRAATNVGRAAIMRNSSVTHSTDNDQRYVGLEIVSTDGNTIRLKVPPNGNVAPPGYYMLWLMDASGNPCQTAKFVRLAHLSCRVIADRSTFSEEEVQALGGGSSANFTKAIYADFDGFLDAELSGTPSFTLTWSDGTAVDSDEVTLQYAARYTEASPPHPDIPTRITFAFNVIFGNMDAFSGWIDRRDFDIEFSLGSHNCDTRIKLSKSPNPYMIDIDPSVNNPNWLSTDVRVFKIRPGQNKYGATFPSSPSASSPYSYIRGLIDRLNGGTQSYSALPIEGANATLDGAYMGGTPPAATFNFAVARVRYRATATTAQDVRCFIRICNYSTTSLSFNNSTVYRTTAGANPAPLLGVAGGEIVSIPFTNEPRVASVTGQSGATGLDSQTLNSTYDIQSITPASSGAEVTVYFGVYLDINQPVKRFPMNPSGDGPYPDASSLPIRDLLRSWHTCMVAEIFLDVDPTEPNSTPSSSDNLSQRNLAITGLENPGRSASRTAMHSFGISPSRSQNGEQFFNPNSEAAPVVGMTHQKRFHFPDELFFDWHNLPADTEVTLYFSDLDTEDLRSLLQTRLSSPAFEILDSNTIKFAVGDVGWLPLPAGREARIPALISIALPDGIVEGQTYKATARQVDGRTNQIIGSFTIEMPVSKAAFLRPEATRQLSFMSHILTTLDTGDRWHPLIERLVMHLGSRVDALGGRSDLIKPNPDGTGEPYQTSDWEPGDPFPTDGFHSGEPCEDGHPGGHGGTNCPIWSVWAIALLVALMLIMLGIAHPALALPVTAIAVIGIGIILYWFSRRCGGILCRFLQGLAIGSVAAIGALGLGMALIGGSVMPIALVLASCGAIVGLVGSYLAKCFGNECD